MRAMGEETSCSGGPHWAVYNRRFGQIWPYYETGCCLLLVLFTTFNLFKNKLKEWTVKLKAAG
jgi:hypothetical protein